MSYRINEIFYSLQGEGCHTGTAVVFVRFSGCNLRCPWCDTEFGNYTKRTAENIVESVNAVNNGAKLVVLTGGEPSLQVDEILINALHKEGYCIAIETNGTHPLPTNIDWITCSPKEGNHLLLKYADEVKVVYTNQDPEHWHNEIKATNWLLQPLEKENTTNVQDVVAYILDHPNWRLSLQTHKMIGIK